MPLNVSARALASFSTFEKSDTRGIMCWGVVRVWCERYKEYARRPYLARNPHPNSAATITCALASASSRGAFQSSSVRSAMTPNGLSPSLTPAWNARSRDQSEVQRRVNIRLNRTIENIRRDVGSDLILRQSALSFRRAQLTHTLTPALTPTFYSCSAKRSLTLHGFTFNSCRTHVLYSRWCRKHRVNGTMRARSRAKVSERKARV